MIFLTVGTQLPFDRLVRAVDDWAKLHPEVEVFGQVGPGAFKPKHFASAPFLAPDEVDSHFSRAELIIGHAGMGTIVSALTLRVPLIVVPRRQALREHRSDHQMATVKQLKDRLGLNIVFDICELPALLDNRHALLPSEALGDSAHPRLLQTLSDFVRSERHETSSWGGIAAWVSGVHKTLRESSSTSRPPA